jgi:vitamin B12 transporter
LGFFLEKPVLSRTTLFLLLIISFHNSLSAAVPDTLRIYIIDGWENQPVTGAVLRNGGHTYKSDKRGLIFITEKLATGSTIVEKTGYYPVFPDPAGLSTGQQIRIFPIMESDLISVSGRRPGLTEPEIAAQTRRIESGSFAYKSGLGDLLIPQNGVFIKSYGGQESAQSIAMRDLGAEQTLVLFDGIPMNSTQTGLTDLQRYRSLLFDEIEIYRGGFSTLAGSGAIAGMINISSGFQPDGISAGYEKRAYDQELINTAFNVHAGITQHNLRFGRDYGSNHYDFKLGDATGRRQNSDYSYTSIGYLGNADLSSQDQADIRILYGRFDNGSPRALLSVDGYQGRARMDEEDWLAQAGWKKQWGEDVLLRAQVYLHRNQSDYRDPDLSVASNHFNQDLGGLVKLSGRLASGVWLYSGIDWISSRLRSSEAGEHSRHRFSIYALGNWQIWETGNASAVVNFALREEIYSDFGIIFLPRGGIDIHFGGWRLYASAGRNFRAPTMNELYWQPGGNPELDPESSTGFETGFGYESGEYIKWNLSAGYYNINVGHMIKWYPGINGIWSTQNIDRVRSDGIEAMVSVRSLFGLVSATANYKYGLAVKSGSEISNDPTVGNRLPYVPGTEFSGLIHLDYHPFSAGLEILYTGFRYETIANNDNYYLPEVWTANAYAGYSISFHPVTCTVYSRVDNLDRTGYQLITGYPLPLQTWVIGMRLEWRPEFRDQSEGTR